MKLGATIWAMAGLLIGGCASKPAPQAAAVAAAAHPLIVRVASRDHVIIVTAGPSGPLYSMTDAAGRLLVLPATLQQLRASRPDLYRQIEPATALVLDASAE